MKEIFDKLLFHFTQKIVEIFHVLLLNPPTDSLANVNILTLLHSPAGLREFIQSVLCYGNKIYLKIPELFLYQNISDYRVWVLTDPFYFSLNIAALEASQLLSIVSHSNVTGAGA